jgi:hypothetical protein
MNDNTTIREMVRKLAGYEDLLFESAICTVSNINTTENTCTCTPIDGSADFVGVQLSMSKSKGFLLVPTDGTIVTVTQVNEFDAFVSMVSDVDQIYLNGDGEDGLVKVNDLVTRMNNIETKVNAHIAIFNAHTHVLINPSIPLNTNLPIPLSTVVLDPTTKSQLENTNIKQG